jgi:hypothetical protein
MNPEKKTTKSKYTKVVINTCYGGFSISPKAIEMLAQRKGKKCYFFDNSCKNVECNPTLINGYPTGLFWTASSTDNLEEFDYTKHNLTNHPENRADSDLVAVVEELGEEANGMHAELKVVKIPSDVKWHIEEYDGNEWVAEEHRTWH